MFKGFYNLTSGMLTQGRNLDVVANNMTNVSTAGYKADRYTASTFQNVLISRVGNKDKSNPAELGNQSYVLASSRLYTDYTQGSMEDSGLPLDFAIDGEGFFAVDSPGGRAYTRAGNFALDNEGYLCLPGVGRVLDAGEQPIRLMTDKITADDRGNLTAEGGGFLGRLGV
ncbi:MAG: flagellar hook-basal body complex protein, partial [Oscillospiraceae bacterium]